MEAQYILTLLMLTVGVNDRVEGEFICTVDGMEGKRVYSTVRDPLYPDPCSRLNYVHSCYGSTCEDYIACQCFDSAGKVPPPVGCWRPGSKLTNPDGTCNSSIANRTAVVKFDSNQNFIRGQCGAFMGCSGTDSFQVFQQECGVSMTTRKVLKGFREYDTLYVVELIDLTTNAFKESDCLRATPAVCNVDIGVEVCRS